MSEKYINIFNKLYDIKDNISEGIYIELNNDMINIIIVIVKLLILIILIIFICFVNVIN